MSIIIFALILSFLVVIHELGHFIAAKWAKIKVSEFGIGYPPKAIRVFRKWGTDFTINWIPFGGFVRMQGEDGEGGEVAKNEESDKKHVKKSKHLSGQFYQASPFKKLVVILAGATVNFVFGVFAFTIVFSSMGIPEPMPDARIAYVAPNSPAEAANLPINVNIIAIRIADEQYNISSSQEAIDVIYNNRGKNVHVVTTGTCEGFTCQEAAFEHNVYLRTQEETPENEGSIGISFDPVIFIKYPAFEMPFRSMIYGVQQAFSLGIQIIQAFSGLVTNMLTKGQLPSDIAGPVGIVHQAETSGLFDEGGMRILSFAGLLSINLAVMNILPLPPLDGGRALFIILEVVFHRKRTQKVEYLVNYGGYIFLLGLIILITVKDVMKLFGR